VTTTKLYHAFVDYIPARLDPDTIYVSVQHAVVAHNCCCGCGLEVVTPLGATDWRLTFDGDTVSLHPSIGNWSFPCRSHYWITNSTIRWAPRLDPHAVERARQIDRALEAQYFDERPGAATTGEIADSENSDERGSKQASLSRLFRSIRRWKVADHHVKSSQPTEPNERR
jgi:hypothetical protein